MAVTVETIEKLNIAQVLQALEQERKAEALLDAQSKALGATKKELVKVLKQQEAASKPSTLQAMTVATQVQTEATKNLSGGFTQLSFQLNDVVSQLAAGAPVAQTFAQQGGQIFQAFQQTPALLGAVASKAAAFAPIIAGTTAVLSPFILLWKDYTDAKDAAREADERWQRVAKDGDSVIRDAAIRVRELNMELAPLTDQQRELERTAQRWKDATAAGTAAIDKEIAATEKAAAAMAKTSPEYAAQTELLEKLQARREKIVQAGKEGFEAERKLAQSRRETAEQDKALEEAEKALEEQRQKAAKATKEAYDEAMAYLRREEEAERKYFENLGKAQEEKDRREAAARQKELADFNAMLKAEGEAEAKRLRESEEAYYKSVETKRAIAAEFAGSTSELFTALMESNQAAADAGSKAAQEAMLRQFEAARAAGIIEAGINTAVAITKASTVAPPPFNVAAMLAAGAAGAAQITTIASQQPPSFTDTPGPVRMGAAMGTAANFAQGDTVVAARTPDDLLKQVLAAVRERPGPAPSVPSSRRRLLGPALARDPIARSLTSDLWRVTRGALPPR